MTDKEILDFITPKQTNYVPVRLGRCCDGGYICPKELIPMAKKCFSFGICNDISFEESLIDRNNNIVIEAYDGSINSLPKENLNNINFHKEFVYFASSSNGIFSNCNDPFIVKMDIEGEEYNFPEILNRDLYNALFITMEIHYLNKNKEKLRSLCIFLKSLGFSCFHVHGNNNVRMTMEINNELCPEVIEATFVKGNFSEYSKEKYPIEGLDNPNNPCFRDLPLPFIESRQH